MSLLQPDGSPLHVLCLCLTVSHPDDDTIRSYVRDARINWQAVLRLAGEHLVTPALAGALRRKAIHPLLPADVQDYLVAIQALNAARNDILRDQLLRIVTALNAGGITPLLLKGAIALMPGQYRGAEDRVIGDLDIAVPFGSVDHARDVMSKLGYHEAVEAWCRMTRAHQRAMHHVPPMLHPSLPVAVELHHRIMRDPEDDAAVRQMLAPVSVELAGGQKILVPDLRSRLLHNFLHAQINDRLAQRRLANLRQLLEFSSLAVQGAAGGQSPEWTMFPTSRLRSLATYWALAERWLGAPWPADLKRAPLEQQELWLVAKVTSKPGWRRASDFYDSALRLPARLENLAKRLWENPRYLHRVLKERCRRSS